MCKFMCLSTYHINVRAYERAVHLLVFVIACLSISGYKPQQLTNRHSISISPDKTVFPLLRSLVC